MIKEINIAISEDLKEFININVNVDNLKLLGHDMAKNILIEYINSELNKIGNKDIYLRCKNDIIFEVMNNFPADYSQIFPNTKSYVLIIGYAAFGKILYHSKYNLEELYDMTDNEFLDKIHEEQNKECINMITSMVKDYSTIGIDDELINYNYFIKVSDEELLRYKHGIEINRYCIGVSKSQRKEVFVDIGDCKTEEELNKVLDKYRSNNDLILRTTADIKFEMDNLSTFVPIVRTPVSIVPGIICGKCSNGINVMSGISLEEFSKDKEKYTNLILEEQNKYTIEHINYCIDNNEENYYKFIPSNILLI